MNFKYAVGEILIFQKARHEPELNGRECLVCAHRGDSIDPVSMTRDEGKFYGIEFEDGTRRSALEYQLRRREEPPTPDASTRDVLAPNEITA